MYSVALILRMVNRSSLPWCFALMWSEACVPMLCPELWWWELMPVVGATTFIPTIEALLVEGDRWASWRSSEEWATCVYRCSDKAQQHCHWTGREVKYMKMYMWISSNIPNVNPAWLYTWGISLFYVPLTKKTCYCMLARDQIKVSQTKLMWRYYENQTSISMFPFNWHGQLQLTNQPLLKLWNQGYPTCLLFFPTSASF